MSPRLAALTGRLALALALPGLAACSSSGEGGGGSTLRNLLLYGGTTEPPVAVTPGLVEARECPAVSVAEGRSAIRVGGEGDTLRSQVSIANVARECLERPDGSVLVKVGVEGRALLGPTGGSGRFDVPVSFALRRGDQVLASRSRRVAVTIPSGQAQASFVVVEGDMVVPPGVPEYEIEVGFGSGSPVARPRPVRRVRVIR